MADTLSPEQAAAMSTAELEKQLANQPATEEVAVKTEPEKVPVSDTNADTDTETKEPEQEQANETEQEGSKEEKQEQTERPKRKFVPRAMLERIARERDEARKELAELKELLARVEKQLVPPESNLEAAEEGEEDLATKLLENPREVLEKILAQRIGPIEQQIKIATLSNIRKELSTKYPDFDKFEPRMIELSRELFPPETFSPDILLKPGVIEKLYLIARAEKMPDYINQAKKEAQNELLNKESVKAKAVFETGKAGEKTPTLTEEQAAKMSLAELEKLLPKVE